MPSRALSPGFNPTRQPRIISKTRILFLGLTISASAVIIFTILYFLYYLWCSLVNRSKTIPFDSCAPLKLQRFSYRELKNATDDFDDANIIGKGGSGTVFRGIIRDSKLLAIKRLDSLSLETEREFQSELQILGGLRSPFLVTLLGYCVERGKRLLVYEYMPNKSLQEMLFGDGHLGFSWERRFDIILDVAKALEFLHCGCDPPVIHGDIKPSNVLLDSDFRAKVSDFGLSRIKVEGEFGVDLFSQDLGRSQELWKSQELSGNLGGTGVETPAISTPVEDNTEVDFALALQASSSSKNSKVSHNVRALNLNSLNYNANMVTESSDVKVLSGKGKEVSNMDIGGDDWNCKFVPYDDEFCSVEHSKELNRNACSVVDDVEDTKQWGKDWWWRQDGSAELCSKDYVMEWIGSQICPSTNPDWDEEQISTPEKAGLSNSTPLDKLEDVNEPQMQESKRGKKNRRKKPRKMQEWWKEEHLSEISNKGSKIKNFKTKWKKGFKIVHIDLGKRLLFRRRNVFGEQNQNDCDQNGEFSFRRGWRRKNALSTGSDMCSGDLFSRELSSTTSMRGTLCYVAPEYGGCGFLIEKADIYSFGVLILVIVSGRRPLHVLASPMKLEKANLVSWCRQLAQTGNILELVDERLKDEYDKEQTSLCINLALACLQKMPELRPDIGDVVRILKGEMDLPSLPFEFSPSPPSKLLSRSRRKQKANGD
ncbi:kinase family protein [Tripterygium wilfordii]|uniref:non-specific serine/threonine protein kinase n=1 Tax=Tripterygium wilfordii TaxID=458696 RepID=A0A7J7CY67_TRIWF|nr:putative receptor-like protein kinase At1g80870 [Tripterygium wilfordii]KAF5739023.1 kinase family protein [Tripterygium wilfordii]